VEPHGGVSGELTAWTALLLCKHRIPATTVYDHEHTPPAPPSQGSTPQLCQCSAGPDRNGPRA
jgi:hypothetical protein